MDICALHPAILVMPMDGLSFAEASASYVGTGRRHASVAEWLRREIGSTLVEVFGPKNVVPGKKAFRVIGIQGSRAPADVVPTLRVDWVRRSPGLPGFLSPPQLDTIEGVVIYSIDGSQTFNFPEQHHENGKAKRLSTGYRFKRVVRMLKRLRDELVEHGGLQTGRVPSFLIECLVYNVPEPIFLVGAADDHQSRLNRVLTSIGVSLGDDQYCRTSCEVNGIKLLFGAHQPWSPTAAMDFVLKAQARLDA